MTFNADIGNVNPSVVTLSNNVGESTYSSNAVGEETVRIFVGNVEVSNIKFNVHASVINRIYVSVSGSDSNIGTIDNPLRTIGAAINKNKEFGGNKTIYVLAGVYEENNLVITDQVTIIGDDATIDAQANRILTISNDTKISGLKFINGVSSDKGSAIYHNGGNLAIYDSVFDNNANGAIMSQSSGVLYINNSTFTNDGAIFANSESIIENCTFNDVINVSSSTIISNSKFKGNKTYAIYVVDNTQANIYIQNNEFVSNDGSIYVLNNNLTVIMNNVFDNYSKSAITIINNPNVIVSGNEFINSDENALDVLSSSVELENNVIASGVININNSTLYNAVIKFLENETVKVSDGEIQINATVSDDMGNIINGGTIFFDGIGEANIVNGKSQILKDFTDGDYVITGSSSSLPNATIKNGLLRVNVKNYWFIGEAGYETLAEAIDAAQDDDVIKGIAGTYYYDQINIGHRTRPDEPWVINKQITITSLSDEPIILSALGKNIFNIDYYSNVTFKNIVFMNANNPNGWGGAIHSMGKNTIVIDNCTFKDNFAEDGGAIHAWGNLYIKNSLFIDNEAGVYAGAVFKDGDGDFIVENTKFINNSAYTYAGAVYSMGYNEIVQRFVNVTFEGNDATCGGAFFTTGKNVTVIDCNFTNNKALNKGSAYEPLGGAAYVYHGAVSFINVNFVDNIAEGNGGALELDNAASTGYGPSGEVYDIRWVTFDNCLIENNTALRYGGAMFTEEFRCYVNVTNTVIKNNSALDYALLVNLYSFYTFDNVTIENNNNAAGNSLIYSYGFADLIETYEANTTILNCIFKDNNANIFNATSEYSNVVISDSVFDGHKSLIVIDESNVILTNNKEINSSGDISVVNNGGILSLENNTFLNPINNTGVIDTPTYVVVIGNETRYETVGNVIIDAVVLDDNNNKIIGNKLVFMVNNVLIDSVLDNGTFKANYTVVASNQTIGAIYEDLGLLDITNKNGVIIGRIVPQLIVNDVEFNISGEFKAQLVFNNIPIADETVVLTVNGVEYVLKTDSNGKCSTILELPFGNYVADVAFNGNEVYAPVSAQANIKVNKLASNIDILANDIHITEDAKIVVALPPLATGNVIITVNGRDYVAVVQSGVASITVAGLPCGEYTVLADYYGDAKYLNSSAKSSFKVTKYDLTVDVTYNSTDINLKVPSDVKGNLTVVIDNSTFEVPVVNGEANIKYNLNPGEHTVQITHPGDEKYAPASYSKVIDVAKKDTVIKVLSSFTCLATDYYAGERGGYITATLKDSDGKVLSINRLKQ